VAARDSSAPAPADDGEFGPAESSVFWGILVVVAEIADRVVRQQGADGDQPSVEGIGSRPPDSLLPSDLTDPANEEFVITVEAKLSEDPALP
jgi:hypothetical protein